MDVEKIKKIIAQYEAIRRLGQTNMFDKNMVQVIAYKNGFYELTIFIEEGRYFEIFKNYGKWIKMIDESDIPEAKPVRCEWELVEDFEEVVE